MKLHLRKLSSKGLFNMLVDGHNGAAVLLDNIRNRKKIKVVAILIAPKTQKYYRITTILRIHQLLVKVLIMIVTEMFYNFTQYFYKLVDSSTENWEQSYQNYIEMVMRDRCIC